MGNNFPLVSILIPTYNRVERLKRAVESALNQSYPRIEILVSDNASEDGTDGYLKSISERGIKYFRQDANIGLIANWNFLVEKAGGDYCLMLSDDDELLDWAIAELIAGFERGAGSELGVDIDVVVGKSSISSKSDGGHHDSISVFSRRELMEQVFRNELHVLPSATLLRTVQVKRVGYRDYYGTAIDLGLLVDLTKNSKIVVANKLVCQYNVHVDNVTAKFDIDDIYKTYTRLLKATYDCSPGDLDSVGRQNVFMKSILSYALTERYARSKISLLRALKYMKKYHEYFSPSGIFLIFSKMIGKKIIYKIK